MISFVIVIFSFFQRSEADFWEERDGWVYNDNGSHKARTHVLTALHKCSSAVWRRIQEIEAFRQQPLQRIIDGVFKGDDFRDNFDLLELHLLFNKTMVEAGIGSREVTVWLQACSKRTTLTINGFLEGIQREINWIAKSDSIRGIKLINSIRRFGEVDYR